MSRSMTLRLPATKSAPAHVRDQLRHDCTELPALLLDDAVLLSSEVVTNAVIHGPTPGMITVAVEWDSASLAVAVGDESATVPVPRASDAVTEGGRGLHLLDALASSWGVRPAGAAPGKVVWFRLGC